jgi:hypothetical protein
LPQASPEQAVDTVNMFKTPRGCRGDGVPGLGAFGSGSFVAFGAVIALDALARACPADFVQGPVDPLDRAQRWRACVAVRTPASGEPPPCGLISASLQSGCSPSSLYDSSTFTQAPVAGRNDSGLWLLWRRREAGGAIRTARDDAWGTQTLGIRQWRSTRATREN